MLLCTKVDSAMSRTRLTTDQQINVDFFQIFNTCYNVSQKKTHVATPPPPPLFTLVAICFPRASLQHVLRYPGQRSAFTESKSGKM